MHLPNFPPGWWVGLVLTVMTFAHDSIYFDPRVFEVGAPSYPLTRRWRVSAPAGIQNANRCSTTCCPLPHPGHPDRHDQSGLAQALGETGPLLADREMVGF